MSQDEISAIVNILSLIFCAALPLIRIAHRFYLNISPLITRDYVRTDMINGFALPYFLLMVVSPILPEARIESHSIVLAGFYGVYMIITELIDQREMITINNRTD